MTDDQWQATIQSKLVGQMNVVKVGLDYIESGGSFTLISGILNIKPMPLAIADATTSGAIDGVMNRGNVFGIVRALPHRPANGPGTKHDTAHRFADTENV
ncbi:short chain dehydrogenase [Pandoraea communis]|uniref:Short chain dehydrogenase n=1 Tax=Pandoraea communis TaxID=2508297 RepID=A0A5E4YCJ1_9BURK|nr:hypothetical protein [Pandoraea communis]VVE46108.1 short chain dehydrogenase [Pandoraea communis]